MTLAEGGELIRGDWGEGVRFPFPVNFQTPTPPLVVQAMGTEPQHAGSASAQHFVALLTFVTESGAPREVGVPARLAPS
ncbi:hypothetical protein EXIGLDRAFT_219552 [Exidia glandulosa HHB12029]|uniref:Uncharacterized protein n=1 Tax=Exidia glandulosa HHB12029 TaxID=1314781 RepID=A0A165ECW5_EXIGL|nr:hypothetical protein EXIGLDRAFT_219552 [Exidia glandulosa HHB12029]